MSNNKSDKSPVAQVQLYLPALPEQAIYQYSLIASMGLETMVRGVRAAIGAIQSVVNANAVRQPA